MTFAFDLKGSRGGVIAALAMTIAVFLTVFLVFASAQNTQRIPLPASQNPSNRDLPISAAVWAGNTLYVSGWLDPDRKTHTDTASQTVGILKDIQKLLESQKLTLGDVAMIRVYLGGDPVKSGKMDFDGMMAGYSQFFGTTEQARTHHGAGGSARC